MDTRAIAEKIADCLFMDGFGRKAFRLVMEQTRKIDGPGWCRGAVVDEVEKALMEAECASNWRTHRPARRQPHEPHD